MEGEPAILNWEKRSVCQISLPMPRVIGGGSSLDGGGCLAASFAPRPWPSNTRYNNSITAVMPVFENFDFCFSYELSNCDIQSISMTFAKNQSNIRRCFRNLHRL
jgi:hypothetical protein